MNKKELTDKLIQLATLLDKRDEDNCSELIKEVFGIELTKHETDYGAEVKIEYRRTMK